MATHRKTTQDGKRPSEHHQGPDVEHERGKPGRDRCTDLEREPEHDVPDRNGEPPSVRRPGRRPEEYEPPVENT
ncbi:hypothetical protein [Cupriavidus sp. IDO]|uniref:hypothetical protein n=1 Tax=Cupriavidus sp. IDO TaxID=1539142 RepID=UPI0005790614|nr:hypothetical protein [Cupriavidus sp. IDO]KWR90540.1 hypothetical protein RM96_08865 [Cupriavidus sp. IDO]